MKRVAPVLLLILWFVPLSGRALPLDALIGFQPRLRCLSDPDAERTRRIAHARPGLDELLSMFDKEIVGKFRNAWQRVGNGTQSRESVVVILKMADGSYGARMPNPTNEYRSFSFAWHPATVAVVHTHPNRSLPYPVGGDLIIADKYKVPVFTLTSLGVFVYDPATRTITKLIDRLDWLQDSTWEKIRDRS